MANEPVIYDSQKVRMEISDILIKGSVLVVDDPEKCYQARVWHRMAVLLYKEAESHYKRIKDPINQARGAILKEEKKDIEPMEQVIELLSPKIISFEEEEERLQKETVLRLEAKAKERAEQQRDDEVGRLETAGKHEQAEELKKRQLFIPPITMPERRDWLEGEGRKTEWCVKEETIDLVQLAAAVASGQLPPTAITPHLPTLDGLADAVKDSSKIPGCEIERRTIITQRKT